MALARGAGETRTVGEKEKPHFLLCLDWVSPILLADPGDLSFLPTSGSFPYRAKPAQPQPTVDKQVLFRFGLQFHVTFPWAGGSSNEPSHDESLYFFPRNKINQKLFPSRRL